jgi:hypothetical protein
MGTGDEKKPVISRNGLAGVYLTGRSDEACTGTLLPNAQHQDIYGRPEMKEYEIQEMQQRDSTACESNSVQTLTRV